MASNSSAKFTLSKGDMENVRAQMVNCVMLAVDALNAANDDVNATLLFSQFNNLSVMFTLSFQDQESRVYFFKLIDPNGTRVSFMRASGGGQPEAFDALDEALCDAIWHFTESTVQRSWDERHAALPLPTVILDSHVLH